jgi:DNA polymerase I-like protein with 3'-5' exonuclease and polymerase domains
MNQLETIALKAYAKLKRDSNGHSSTVKVQGPAYDINDINDKSPPPDPSAAYTLVHKQEDLQAVAVSLDESNRVALDCETTGLDPRQDRLRLLSLATERGTYLVDCFAVDPSELWPLLAEKLVVGHNLAFDLGFLSRCGFVAGKVADTMLMSQLLHAGNHCSHKLQEVVQRELGEALDKAEQQSDWSADPLSAEQFAYAAADVNVLVPLHDALTSKLRAAKLLPVVEMEHRCLPAMIWLAESGVAFDAAVWRKLAEEANAEASRLADELDAAAPRRNGHLSAAEAWNWDSPQQVKEALTAAGCPVEKTDDDALARLDLPLARLLRQYREARKRTSTYGTDWLKHVAEDGRVYAKWLQLGAASGRMACSAPNLQQVPRGEHRRCFRAPPGRVLVKADYSQIELRIAAKVSGDKAMLTAYQKGEDLHVRTAIPIVPEEAIQSTALLCLWAGVPPNRTGAEVLCHLWTGPCSRTEEAKYLRHSSKDGADSAARSGVGGSAAGGSQPSVERWSVTAALAGLPEALLRAVRGYQVSRCAPSGPQPETQSALELRDALSVLPCCGTSTLRQLNPGWPHWRQIGKACGFGLVYGMGARAFQAYARANYGVELSLEQAQGYRAAFFKAYPGLRRWHNRQNNGSQFATHTLCGRRRLDVQRFTEQLNTPVQGTGADGLKRALALLWERRTDVGNLPTSSATFPVLVSHDEIVVECDLGQAEAVSAWLKQAMLDGMADLIAPVPVEVDVTVAPTWGG